MKNSIQIKLVAGLTVLIFTLASLPILPANASSDAPAPAPDTAGTGIRTIQPEDSQDPNTAPENPMKQINGAPKNPNNIDGFTGDSLNPPTQDNQAGNPNNETNNPINSFTPGTQVNREYEKDASTSFYAYDQAYRGGVRVAGGDVDGDGFDEIITGAGVDQGPNAGQGSGSHIQVFSVDENGKETSIKSFFAFDPGFVGGVNVEAGDVNGDGAKDIIVAAGIGGNAHVKVFDGRTNELIRSFFAYDNFQGEVRIASADVTGDGVADIITGAGPGGGPHVKVFDGLTGQEVKSFFALEEGFKGGIFVASGDVNGDGKADIVVTTDAELGRAPMVYVFDGNTNAQIATFKAFDATQNGDFYGGVRVSTKDVNSDGLADIIVSSGPGPNTPGHVRFFETTLGSGGDLSFKGTVSFNPYDAFAGGVRATFGFFKAGYGILTGAGGGKYDSPLGPDNIAGPHVKIFYPPKPKTDLLVSTTTATSAADTQPRGLQVTQSSLITSVNGQVVSVATTSSTPLRGIPARPPQPQQNNPAFPPPVAQQNINPIINPGFPPPVAQQNVLPVVVIPQQISQPSPSDLSANSKQVISEIIVDAGVILTNFRLGGNTFLEVKTDKKESRNIFKLAAENIFKIHKNPKGKVTAITHDGNGYPKDSILALDPKSGLLYQVNIPGVPDTTTGNVAKVDYPGDEKVNITLNSGENVLFDLLT